MFLIKAIFILDIKKTYYFFVVEINVVVKHEAKVQHNVAVLPDRYARIVLNP